MKFSNIFYLLFISFFISSCEEEYVQPEQGDLPIFSIADVNIEEGNVDTLLSVKVTLTGVNNANAILSYATLGSSAVADEDFKNIDGGQLVFAPDETEKNISIKIIADDKEEIDEQFEILFFNPVNATLANEKAVVTILNDDKDIDPNILVIPSSGYTTPTSYDGYELTWSDEFQAAELNLEDWGYDLGRGNNGWGNNELQTYTEENAYIADDEYLVIEAREEPLDGAAYTSSRIKTLGKKHFKFGRIDIRAALPETQGLWPALWMMGSNINAVGWPRCGEIDIMELAGGNPSQIFGTTHFGTSPGNRSMNGSSKVLPNGAKFSEEFHVFSLIWEEDKIQFLLDDAVFHEVTPASTGDLPYPFNESFFFLFNVAVGGDFTGAPDDSTILPQRMIVDYVRVFQ